MGVGVGVGVGVLHGGWNLGLRRGADEDSRAARPRGVGVHWGRDSGCSLQACMDSGPCAMQEEARCLIIG